MISRHLHITKTGRYFNKEFQQKVLDYYSEYGHMVYTIRTTIRPDAVGNMLLALSNKCLFLMKQSNNYHRRYLTKIRHIREFFGLQEYPLENWAWMNFQRKLINGQGIMSKFVMDTKRFGVELYRYCDKGNKYHCLYKFHNDGMVDIYNLNNRVALDLLDAARNLDRA